MDWYEPGLRPEEARQYLIFTMPRGDARGHSRGYLLSALPEAGRWLGPDPDSDSDSGIYSR